MDELREMLLDVSLIAARMATDTGRRYSLDEMLERFGFTREQLLAESGYPPQRVAEVGRSESASS